MSEAIAKVEPQQAGSMNEPPRSLVRKLAEVMGEVERVAKSGRNEFHRYDYATEADIVASVRGAMSQRHLMLVPNVEKLEWKEIPRQKGGTDRLATMTVAFTLMDGDSGEAHTFHVVGEGQDAGDKATYKALTGATKYALLKLFLIPTGDDPENEAPQRGPPPSQRVQPPARQSSPPPEERRAAPPTPKAGAAGEPSEMEKLAVGIAESDSPKALLAVGVRIKQAQQANLISKAEREELATLYGAKQKDLRGGK